MKPGTLTAAVVTWNSADTIAACLDSLLGQTRKPDAVYVYDNASSDRTRAMLESYGARINVIHGQENSGFCSAHNSIIKATESEFHLLVNPDIAMTPTYIERALSALEADSQVGTACGLLLQRIRAGDDRLIDGTGLVFTRSRRFLLRDHGRRAAELNLARGQVFGCDGALPLYRRTMMEDVSVDGCFFDPVFFAHKEDHDVAWRSRLFGWKTTFEPAAIATHPRVFRPGDLRLRKKLSDEMKYHAVKNDLLMLLKNESSSDLLRDFFQIVPRRLAIALYSLLFERGSLPAYSFIFRNLGATMRVRKKIQKRRRASRTELRRWL